MSQLDLFADAPRHYHEALRCLGRLDALGCGRELAEHRRRFPVGLDPGPVEEAAAWLEARLPEPGQGVAALGPRCLTLCLALQRNGAKLPLLAPEGELTQSVLRATAGAALEAMAAAGLAPESPLAEGLPWGIFELWRGRPAAARRHLLAWLGGAEAVATTWLALGDACWRAGRRDEAACAYREGYGLDPSGRGWQVADAGMPSLRERAERIPGYAGPWWAVGAYLDGGFPAYGEEAPPVAALRWRRFAARREAWGASPEAVSAPAFFFSGLCLSEQGTRLGDRELSAVRETLRALHADAYEWHLEVLRDRGGAGADKRGAPLPG